MTITTSFWARMGVLSAVAAMWGCVGSPDATDGDQTDANDTSDSALAQCNQIGSLLSVTKLSNNLIASMGTPFDADRNDTVGPFDSTTNYGKTPEIVAVPNGSSLEILWRDTASSSSPRAFVVHVEPQNNGYAVTRAYQVGLLGTVMGFTIDRQGNYYYATGVKESTTISPSNPAAGVHRPGIVHIVKFNTQGCVLLDIDVDTARETALSTSQPIVNPTVASTSRLAFGGGRLALVHGINSAYDPGVRARHQQAITTHFNASTGAVTRTSTLFVAHSFEQRTFWDGNGLVELHLGDAYPRAIAMGRFTDTTSTDRYPLFFPKGNLGDNNTWTRLGGIAPVNSGGYGYFVAFETDRTTKVGPSAGQIDNTARDVAIVRVRRDFSTFDAGGSGFLDTNFGASQTVTSAGVSRTNHLRWITNYGFGNRSDRHAARSRIVNIGSTGFVVLWEKWIRSGSRYSFDGTVGTLVSEVGNIRSNEKAVSGNHIPRGDDAVALNGQAVFVTGDSVAKRLVLHLVNGTLNTTDIELR